jgi:hypothetical protein
LRLDSGKGIVFAVAVAQNTILIAFALRLDSGKAIVFVVTVAQNTIAIAIAVTNETALAFTTTLHFDQYSFT